MRTTSYVKRSLGMLTPGQRKRFFVSLLGQMAPALIDLAGVLLLGLLLSQAQSLINKSNSSNSILPTRIFNLSQNNSILVLFALVFICFSLRSLISPNLQKRLQIYLGRLATQFALKLESRYFQRDILFIQKRSSQELMWLLNTAIFQALTDIIGYFALVVSELSLLILLTSLLFFLNPYLTFFVIGFFSLIIYILNRLSKNFTRRESQKLNAAKVQANSLIAETMDSYREIYSNQKFGYFLESAVESLGTSARASANIAWVNLVPKYVLDSALVIGIGLVGFGAWLTQDHIEAVRTTVIFVIVASRLMPSILRINTGLQAINNNSDAADRVYSLVSDIEESEMTDTQISEIKFKGDSKSLIQVDRLNFAYPGSSKNIFKDLSFSVESGDFLAIVGPSGVGKSTLVDLLLGVTNDLTGSISIQNMAPRNFVQANPGAIGYVPQRVNLMNRPILENIAMGYAKDEVDEIQLDRVLKLASLEGFVSGLPEGINEVVGENGFNLSGGQIQRIGLARALYSNPDVLILDEATSALDAETENAISQSLAAISGKVTLIIVAHRLATVRKATKILYLGEENFFTLGTFDELREKVPSFDRQAKLLGL